MTRKLVFINDSNKSENNTQQINSLHSSVSTCSPVESIKINLKSSENGCKCFQTKKTNSNKENSRETKTKQSLLNKTDKNNSSLLNSKMQTNRLITTFEELSNLEARSRQPIDITNVPMSANRLVEPLIQNNSTNTPETTKNRKYFSFMTTNRQFTDLNRANELRLKIQLFNELNQANEVKHLNSFSSSSSTTSGESSCEYGQLGMDSGCGSSIARSSITECPETSIEHISLNRNNNNSNSKNINNSRKKTLTVLFDYETESKTFNEKKCNFSVRKGEKVKVIRDYDEKFYLVATCVNNRIGFIPKEYTVDLNELKQRYKESIMSNSSLSDTECNSKINQRLSHL